MAYEWLQERLDNGEVILLDGAIGTELQRRDVPMDDDIWCVSALKTHPDTVRTLHEDYIRAGVDVITTNTFCSGRFALEITGLGDETAGLNRLAVDLARQARDKVADRDVAIAGSIAPYGPGGVPQRKPSIEKLENDYREQAQIMADAGVDLIALEMLSDVEQAELAIRAALSSGLPVWLGFTCRVPEGSSEVLFVHRHETATFEEGLRSLVAMGGSALTIIHADVSETPPGLEVAKRVWQGPLGAYAESGYFENPNWQFVNVISPEDYAAEAVKWVSMGTQIVGGCCGIGLEHIRVLRERLPDRIPDGSR